MFYPAESAITAPNQYPELVGINPLDANGLRERIQADLDVFVADHRSLMSAVSPDTLPLLDSLEGLLSGGKRLRPMLTLAAALKLLETRAPRDYVILIFLGWFLCLATFLGAQDITATVWVLPTVWLLAAALLLAGPVRVRDLFVEGRPVVAAGQVVTIDLPSVIEAQNRLALRLAQ